MTESDFEAPDRVTTPLRDVYARLYPTPPTLFPRVAVDVAKMFAGHYLDYQAIDTPYHDLAHTWSVTTCCAALLEGRALAGDAPVLTARQFDLALTAALLHDTGYLKLRSDLTGTGAKYTFTHVLRSCVVASSYLPTLGVSLSELDTVLGAIRCTHATTDLAHLHFPTPADRVLGQAVATADYVGQMSAPDYVEDLPLLYAEFSESDDYAGVPVDQRPFASVAELVAHTPAFWRETVRPKLDEELGGLYRYLARPYPDGPNAPLQAIEANVQRIQASTTA